jgi:Fic family protein
MASDGVGAWPEVVWERHRWVPLISPALVPPLVRERHAGPYRAAVVPELADIVAALPTATLALADEASIELARFDVEMGAAPFGPVLLKQEAAASSRIGNLRAGAKPIAQAALGGQEKRSATKIVANVRAMNAANELAGQLDENVVLAVHSALLGEHGQWRSQQVWNGGSDFGPHHADYVPPHPDRVADAMADLFAFVRRYDIPVLAHAALAHAQFEAIQPFLAGNGRVGRVLLHAMLRVKGLTRDATVPLSAGLLTNIQDYFDALTAYRDGDPHRIVAIIAEATFVAIANGRKLAADLHEIRTQWDTVITARADSVAWSLADLLLRQPVIDSGAVQRELGATSANAQRAIRQLAAAGVITEFTDRKRNRLYQNTDVLAALDAFATRSIRRA